MEFHSFQRLSIKNTMIQNVGCMSSYGLFPYIVICLETILKNIPIEFCDTLYTDCILVIIKLEFVQINLVLVCLLPFSHQLYKCVLLIETRPTTLKIKCTFYTSMYLTIVILIFLFLKCVC